MRMMPILTVRVAGNLRLLPGSDLGAQVRDPDGIGLQERMAGVEPPRGRPSLPRGPPVAVRNPAPKTTGPRQKSSEAPAGWLLEIHLPHGHTHIASHKCVRGPCDHQESPGQ